MSAFAKLYTDFRVSPFGQCLMFNWPDNFDGVGTWGNGEGKEYINVVANHGNMCYITAFLECELHFTITFDPPGSTSQVYVNLYDHQENLLANQSYTDVNVDFSYTLPLAACFYIFEFLITDTNASSSEIKIEFS